MKIKKDEINLIIKQTFINFNFLKTIIKYKDQASLDDHKDKLQEKVQMKKHILKHII